MGELEEIERANVGEVLFDRTGKPSCPLWVKSRHREANLKTLPFNVLEIIEDMDLLPFDPRLESDMDQ